MKLKHRQVAFKIKATKDDGTFSGYGSVFGVADAYRDIVMPGAFAKTLANWKAQDALPPCLWQHKPDQPIGPFTMMAEDGKGLYVEGKLLIDDVKKAREAHALLKSGTIRGMSIGYDIPDGGIEYDSKANVYRLSEVELWECSLATFPANVEATVTSVKAILKSGRNPTLPEFEELLRDAAGFSRKQATAIASHGYAKFLTQRDAVGGNDDAETLALDDLVAHITAFQH
jgi:uncharacterized protein